MMELPPHWTMYDELYRPQSEETGCRAGSEQDAHRRVVIGKPLKAYITVR